MVAAPCASPIGHCTGLYFDPYRAGPAVERTQSVLALFSELNVFDFPD
jgi:hypothetical protein